jgi:hypothetical protein
MGRNASINVISSVMAWFQRSDGERSGNNCVSSRSGASL